MDGYKLDKTIKEFESEVKKLKSVNEIYEKLDVTYNEIVNNADLCKINNEQILSIKGQLESTLSDHKKFQDKLFELSSATKDNLEQGIDSLRAENTQNRNGILENIEKIDEVYDNKIADIRIENRESYQELEKMLSSKLETILSDYKKFQNKLLDLNNSIKDNLEQEIDAFKEENAQNRSGMLENIEKLDEVYDKKIGDIREENRESYQELEKMLSSRLETILSDYKNFENKFLDLNNTIKDNLEQRMDELRLENSQNRNGVLENIEKLDRVYDKKIVDMRKENRESYQELEKLLSSKLERMKSDVEVNIRDGNINIERVIGNQFDLKFIQFNELITKNFEQVEKKTTRQLMFSVGVLLVVIINIIVNFVFK